MNSIKGLGVLFILLGAISCGSDDLGNGDCPKEFTSRRVAGEQTNLGLKVRISTWVVSQEESSFVLPSYCSNKEVIRTVKLQFTSGEEYFFEPDIDSASFSIDASLVPEVENVVSFYLNELTVKRVAGGSSAEDEERSATQADLDASTAKIIRFLVTDNNKVRMGVAVTLEDQQFQAQHSVTLAERSLLF